jgi:hypothetical protein
MNGLTSYIVSGGSLWGGLGRWLHGGIYGIISPVLSKVAFAIAERRMAALEAAELALLEDTEDEDEDVVSDSEEEEESEEEDSSSAHAANEIAWVIMGVLATGMEPPPSIKDRATHVVSSLPDNAHQREAVLYTAKSYLYNHRMAMFRESVPSLPAHVSYICDLLEPIDQSEHPLRAYARQLFIVPSEPEEEEESSL